MFILEEI